MHHSGCRDYPADGTIRPVIVFAANSCWNLVNFRANLIIALQQQGYRIVAIAGADSEELRLADLGVNVHTLECKSSSISPLHDLLLFLRYFFLLRAIRPVAFLGFTIKPNIYGSLAARLLRLPTINNISGLGTVFIKRNMITRFAIGLYRVAIRHSATVFFQNSEDHKEFTSTRIVTQNQGKLIPGSGIDLERFFPTSIPTDKSFKFLLIARLLWDKGLREYVEAARIVRREYPDTRFQVLGFADTDNRTAIPRKVLDGWVEEGLIEYLGASNDVRPFIANASCVVLPSYREGLPRCLLEASAMSRPIIGTDVPGVRDVVDCGVTGILCEARNEESLATAMLTIIKMSPEQRKKIGQEGRKRVERDFDIKVVTQKYLDAVQGALEC